MNTGQATLEDGEWEWWRAKKVGYYFRERKKVITFFRKNRVTPSVAAPGDSNVSDATVYFSQAAEIRTFKSISELCS